MGPRGLARARIALATLGLAMSVSAAYAQTPPGKPEPLLGRVHLWAKIGRADIDAAAASAWGVDREEYLGLEVYGGTGREFYLGGEIGHFGAGRTVTASGDTIRDLDFWWLELNEKKAFDLKRGFTFDAGLGAALFYVGGKDVGTAGGMTFSDPLADFGYGAQAFVDFTWRTRHFLLGVDAKYQKSFDFIEVDYSNLRLGGHLGVAF